MEYPENRYKIKILTIPNLLSFFRLCLIPLIVWQYVGKNNYFATLYLLALSGITDLADGIIARKLNMVSDFGKVFDPIADKLTQVTMLFCLVIGFPNMLLPLILLIIKELFAGITGFMMVKRNVIIGADWHGKVTTALLYGTMLVHLAWANITPAVSNILVGACAVMIILSGILYGFRNLTCLRSGDTVYEKI